MTWKLTEPTARKEPHCLSKGGNKTLRGSARMVYTVSVVKLMQPLLTAMDWRMKNSSLAAVFNVAYMLVVDITDLRQSWKPKKKKHPRCLHLSGKPLHPLGPHPWVQGPALPGLLSAPTSAVGQTQNRNYLLRVPKKQSIWHKNFARHLRNSKIPHKSTFQTLEQWWSTRLLRSSKVA